MNTKHEWIIVGGGIAGITIGEILTREGRQVLLLEKNDKLASETSKVFHEWMHSGSLYTLVPDKLLTLRYLLGATDDLIEYYGSFDNMNMKPTERGIDICNKGWFNNQNIIYKYRCHKANPMWMMLVSRSLHLIEMISKHDWLRRRAGAEYGNDKMKIKSWVSNIPMQLRTSSKFIHMQSPDVTMNSRLLISDILSIAMDNGLEVKTNSDVIYVEEDKNKVIVKTLGNSYMTDNVVICAPEYLAKKDRIPIKTSYAPIAVVDGLSSTQESFVELDYNTKKCINLLVKKDGIGQAGGISLKEKKDVPNYLKYIIDQHKKRVPNIEVIDTYLGLKREFVHRGESRNYLYHINHTSKRTWSVVLGKFSLAFSMAPEFYRRVYGANPTKYTRAETSSKSAKTHNLVSDTSWMEIVKNRGI
jgi:FAD dependent oxidoreductase